MTVVRTGMAATLVSHNAGSWMAWK